MPTGTETRLREPGFAFPSPPATAGNYLSARTIGNFVFLVGVISTDPAGVITGTLGVDRTIPEEYAAARACALTQLTVLREHLGSLDAVKTVVSVNGCVNGCVNAIPGFPESPKVVNGASDFLVELFGEAGRHVRAPFGVSAPPRNALVELQMRVEIDA